jgi:tetratricopeptide (TPR) repeat protein
MSELAYIESYFKGELSAGERMEFDQKISDDPAFAEEVAFYCSAMDAVKEDLAEEKKKQFRKIYEEGKSRDKKVRSSFVKRFWPYMTAAAVLAGLIAGIYLFSKHPSPQQLADQYIGNHFSVLGVKMGEKEDSLEAAKNLYNNKQFPEALRKFEKIIREDSAADEPKKMAGIVSLRMGDYDKAIEYFTQLENLRLYSNPGKFLHALALIKRNRTGDREMAKELLKQVVDLNLGEKETARKWLKSF